MTTYTRDNIALTNPIKLPCGGTAYFDHESGISYRCVDCMAVVGSMGMPDYCQEEAQKYRNWKAMGGKGWDYIGREDDE